MTSSEDFIPEDEPPIVYRCYSCGSEFTEEDCEPQFLSVWVRARHDRVWLSSNPESVRIPGGVRPDSTDSFYASVAHCDDCCVECYNCGHVSTSDDAIDGLDEQLRCSDCHYESHSSCESCGETIWSDDAHYSEHGDAGPFCSSCYSDYEEEDSDYYDGDRRDGRCVTLPNGRPLIEPYHHTDENDENFCHTEYIPLPEIEDGGFVVTGIKRHRLVVVRRVPDKFPAIGIELEKKIRDTSKRIEAARFLLDGVRPNYLLLKEDATVNGWETVTYPADWRAHMELFPWDKLPLLGSQYGMYAWNDRDRMCGLHIHISRSAFRPSHLHRFVSFHDNHIEQLVKFSGRHNRVYAPHGRDYYDDRKLQAMGLRGSNHSVAVNFGPSGSKTIELRYFRGSLKPETVKSAIQFTHALWLFTKDMTYSDVRYGANTFDKFVAFASENVAEYPDLYPRLVERGLTEATN